MTIDELIETLDKEESPITRATYWSIRANLEIARQLERLEATIRLIGSAPQPGGPLWPKH